MKIAFSTLGCPEWGWEDMISTASDLGFDGIEVRGIENELYVPNAKPFLASNLEHTKAKLSKTGLDIPCLTSACYLFNKENITYHIQEAKEYIDLAEKLGTKYIRVLGDANPQPGTDIDFEFVAAKLGQITQYAEGKNVKVIIETNGVFADSDVMLKLVQKVNSKKLGVLWDIHHPYRYMGESVSKTYNTLKEYIEYVHIKDSLVENGKVKYKMMGYGDVPVKEALETLKKNSYSGFVSLEWVKRWCIELEDPGVVFSHFINYVRELI